MSTSPIIVWIRKDLRLFDNPALFHAVEKKTPLILLFIWSPQEEGIWTMGEAQQWWLHHSLQAFSSSLEPYSQSLVIRHGPCTSTLLDVARETGSKAVYWNKVYEPNEANRDQNIATALQKNGINALQWESQLLHDPTLVSTGKGTPYKVFTPFWRTIQKTILVPNPLEIPAFTRGSMMPLAIDSLHVDALHLLPTLNWADEFPKAWQPGENTARNRLHKFLNKSIIDYNLSRDFPNTDGTSRLSPHLHFGEISSRTIWHEITKGESPLDLNEGKIPFLRQLIWREFAYHLIHHFPYTSEKNLRDTFDKFPWSTNAEHLLAWQKGQTGYPIVDAGMRQLWQTGWMHNRVRMVVASFLTKHLLMHWLEGARWFWDTLVDANLPNNTMGWQWAAGSGADAQPFFRIFNPMNQGKKFDPKGEYVRTWLPELQQVPTKLIHEPWLMNQTQQRKSNVILGKHYPKPVVDHKEAREFALHAYKNISK